MFLGIGIYVFILKYMDVFDLIINAECLERYGQARTILSNKVRKFGILKRHLPLFLKSSARERYAFLTLLHFEL